MPIAKLSLASVAVLALAGAAFGQDAPTLRDLDADRIGPEEVRVEFEYDGSACEEVQPAEIGENVDGTLAVTFSAVSTAEVCTMQIVEIEVEQTIMADETVSRLEVTLRGTNGEVYATGTTDIDDDDDDHDDDDDDRRDSARPTP
ncbi:hypothetical protein EMQ25_16215 [Arsenicitalea aurantiaca]|uniref:Uncharacterized protein n=1 Tax=Arsenicitalea aurantiaca TaxID=1783274 RepID=A0A433X387_9HYPH|nr:hypothetical protein [Arsenicitalea aurantiaca]RUT28522.1 hypothetical protein EMQ25_16215 [Arsenicitalea aurantiaca]